MQIRRTVSFGSVVPARCIANWWPTHNLTQMDNRAPHNRRVLRTSFNQKSTHANFVSQVCNAFVAAVGEFVETPLLGLVGKAIVSLVRGHGIFSGRVC